MRIAIIGAGVVGSLIARELTKYEAEIEIFEKYPDVGWGVTKANSGVIHAGYDDEPGTVRSKYCTHGNSLYTKLSYELGFPIKRTGSLVAAFDDEEVKVLEKLLDYGKKNGVEGLKILDKYESLEKEPNLSKMVIASLWAPSTGIIGPWEVAQAAIENAIDNGAKIHLSTEVKGIKKANKKVLVEVDDRDYEFDFVVNASGLWADVLAESAGVKVTPLHPRKGEYILLDQSDLVRTVVFPVPSKAGKGILVLPTIHNTTLLGPTSEDLPPDWRDRNETTAEGIRKIIENTKKLVPSINLSKSIRTFAGLRPENDLKDFVVVKEENMVNVVATRSPGLTSAPAMAEDIANWIVGLRSLKLNKNFNPYRKPIPRPYEMEDEEKEKLIRENPAFGRVICRCNKVTEGEVIEAIKRGARTLDGVKLRTTAMFGRCQGSFCTVNIMKIIKRETGMNFEDIEKNLPSSKVVDGVLR
ncbi:MAG: NAD(P)/FAD-dependent oxidoreductase [Athalassotoga sp.]|uniref:NAD(P)/FAD-dependent oxidoreductase n=1 Tax=Athalassotoga sp. TaxID=2022597 RepID=UPI003D07F79B